MASRTIVPQQGRAGEAEVGGAGAAVHNQTNKNAAAGDGRSRRALGDIGNVVNVRGAAVEGKAQRQIHRPLTRSFCAQLLANAEAAAAVEKNKKILIQNLRLFGISENVCVKVDKAPVLDGAAVVSKRGVAAVPKAVQKKPVAKPVPAQAEVIEISPDVNEVVEVKEKKRKKVVDVKNNNKVTQREESSKKKQHTFSSALTARSKAAHGIANKPKEEIVHDIDEADADNHLAGVEYVEDIYKFYKSIENESMPNDYMHLQTDINEKMRSILVDWLIDVHQKFELSPEALYLTVNLIDRFLSVKVVPRRELQLLGMSAMLIATKYEEIWPPEVNDLVCIADRAYTHEQILLMEKTILGRLEWTVTVPTHYVFLARFIKASIPDPKMENMVYFLAELGIMHYETIRFCPSMVAASAVYAARCALNKSESWTDTLKFHTGYSESQLVDCAKLLAYFHSKAAEGRLHVVYKKYSSSLRGAVASVPPSKNLLSAESRLQVV
ncbi:LOW QUALITY PROTEIN: G2/mitotic-specific cyclin S13-7-like [Hibiscus syriacus]|uniref:LOW QUALITY PROTEIN: G2/mitotic-specific cyclin S13-7-like n=1 Tax=Hibiscus syriacus TaxID=106335 RepID=UPI0019238BC5|nr:LOW QUALITY PROTEIN: G2/mitotic-specific cyclin S13-7-like [Hibiscus syriacus]